MSDDDWIRALKKHNRDENEVGRAGPSRGAVQLAQLLGRRTKDDPERFAKLALRFTRDIHPEAMTAVLSNTEDAIEVELLTELCERAHDTYGPPVSRWICRSIWPCRGREPSSGRTPGRLLTRRRILIENWRVPRLAAVSTTGTVTCPRRG